MVKILVLAFVVVVISAERELPLNVKDPRFRNPTGAESKVEYSDCPVCETEECISAAARILESLDLNIDPCDDFYQFACNGWINKRILPPHRSSLGSVYDTDLHLALAKTMLSEKPNLSDLTSVVKAKNLYSSCIKHAVEPGENGSIVDVIKGRFGTWPLTGGKWKECEFDMEDFLTKAIHLGVHPLIRFEVTGIYSDTNGKAEYKNMLTLKQPGLGLPASTFSDMSDDSLLFDIYSKKIFADAQRFGIVDEETAMEDVRDIVQVERTLAHMLDSDDSGCDCTLGELQEIYGQVFDWTRVLATITSTPNVGITDITPDEKVVVHNADYLRNMTDYFSELPARTKANYIIWRVLDSLENVLVHEDSKAKFVLNHAVYGTTAQPSPEESCVTYVSKVFKLAVYRLFYTAQVPLEERKVAYDMLKRIKEEFDEVVDEHEWVDKPSAKVIKEKNEALSMKLMYLERSLNDTYLENYYANVTVDEHNFTDTVLKEREEASSRNLRLLRKPYEISIEQLPFESVAQNSFEDNRIEITSPEFEPPLFTRGVPQSMNYGGIGCTFGHELIHAFDDSGYKHNKEGVEGHWWSNDTVSIFQQRHQCMINQYNNFFYKVAGKYVDGTLTLGENIADNGGIKLAYRAYRKAATSLAKQELPIPGFNFSDNKLFFINFAQTWCVIENKESALASLKDTHSPSEFRVIGPIQNSKDFASAFNCPVGSPMNPATKCEVW